MNGKMPMENSFDAAAAVPRHGVSFAYEASTLQPCCSFAALCRQGGLVSSERTQTNKKQHAMQRVMRHDF
jgi:hypothetical protein